MHPYKGKFIAQLVEYSLDSHTDEFKKEVYFNKGDIILDPFCGSGTTLVQANELGIHAIVFNALISNVKCSKHNFTLIEETINEINSKFRAFQNKNNILFEKDLSFKLAEFNTRNMPPFFGTL